jgi:hypothetical protein
VVAELRWGVKWFSTQEPITRERINKGGREREWRTDPRVRSHTQLLRNDIIATLVQEQATFFLDNEERCISACYQANRMQNNNSIIWEWTCIRVTPQWLILRCSAAGGAGLTGAPCGVSNLGMAALAPAVLGLAGLRHPASAAPGPNGFHPDGLLVLNLEAYYTKFHHHLNMINNVLSLPPQAAE